MAGSVVAEHVDELRFPLAGVARDAELPGALAEALDGPVVVVSGRAAAMADLVATVARRSVGDAGGLLLRGSVLAELFVQLRVFQTVRAASLRHGDLLPESVEGTLCTRAAGRGGIDTDGVAD